ncbi:MAG: hypothetical protein KAR19_01050 [Bacteroidales bacterium]|nr:hypothetical protein [Bacteroidales bacterium]
MKTTKLILSITLVALVTTSFGQLASIDGHSRLNALKNRIFPNRNTEVVYSKANYEAPVVSRSIFIEQAEIIFEDDVLMENWMTAPFESSVAEEEISIESWMTAPFEAGEVVEIEE